MSRLSVFQIVLTAVFGALAVAAVLVFAFFVTSGSSNTVGPVVIWGTYDRNTVTGIIQDLIDTDSNFQQVTYEQKSKDSYMRELTEALAAGSGPDLFLVRQDEANQVTPRVVPIPYETLARTKFEETFIDAASPFLSAEGVIGVPFLSDPVVLYWNRDLLATAGYPEPPEYWDQMYDFARGVIERTETGGIRKYAIAFGEYQNIAHAKLLLSILIMQAGGSITERDQEGRLIPALSPTSSDTRQATLSALRFYTEFADPSKDVYSWNRSAREAQAAFVAGDLALYFGLASEARTIAQMNPNLHFSIAGVPQVRGVNALSGGYVYALAIPRASKNPTGALTIAFTLAGREASDVFVSTLGYVSARRDALSERGGETEVVRKQAVIMRSWIDPDPEKTAEIFRGMIEGTTSGAMLVTEAIQRAEQQLQNLLTL